MADDAAQRGRKYMKADFVFSYHVCKQKNRVILHSFLPGWRNW